MITVLGNSRSINIIISLRRRSYETMMSIDAEKPNRLKAYILGCPSAFLFLRHCNYFCGSGHKEIMGKLEKIYSLENSQLVCNIQYVLSDLVLIITTYSYED